MEVVITPDATTAAQVVAGVIARVLTSRAAPVLGLATGSSPLGVYGELIEFFQLGGAKAVIFDILFTEPEIGTRSSATVSEQDQTLALMTQGFSGTVHAMLLNKDVEDIGGSDLNKPMPSLVEQRFALPIDASVVSGIQNTYTLPIDIITQSTPYIGVVGLDPDADGVYRRVKPLWTYDGHVYPALSLTPLLVDNANVDISLTEQRLHVATSVMPLDDNGRILVNVYGYMQPISIVKVFQTYNQLTSGDVENLPLDPFQFENKVVFIGASAIGLDATKPITATLSVDSGQAFTSWRSPTDVVIDELADDLAEGPGQAADDEP